MQRPNLTSPGRTLSTRRTDLGQGTLGALPLLPSEVAGLPSWLIILLDVVLSACVLALAAIFLAPFIRAFR